MPITIPPVSRRRFLGSSISAAAALLSGCAHLGGGRRAPADPDFLALVSDTHINTNKAYVHKTGARPWEQFQQVLSDVRAMSRRPAAMLFCGDNAFLKGLAPDYARLVEAVSPLSEAGIPLHLALGNHDDRKNFWAALPADAQRRAELSDRQVLLLKAQWANLYLLDSLEFTDKVPGLLGKEQLDWLARSLDSNADKPALVMAHHDLGKESGSLKDSKQLLDVLLPRKQVKAYIYGHTHVWAHSQIDGLHLVNLPTTAWLFDKTRTQGWVELRLRQDRASFLLHALNSGHYQNGQRVEIYLS